MTEGEKDGIKRNFMVKYYTVEKLYTKTLYGYQEDYEENNKKDEMAGMPNIIRT